jgi:hypothetical protein
LEALEVLTALPEYPFTLPNEQTANGRYGYFPGLPISASVSSTAPLTSRRTNGNVTQSAQPNGHARQHNRVDDSENPENSGRGIQFQKRIKHFTWTWFTMTMATGGIANVIYHLPYNFSGRYTIGLIFFLFNIALFLFDVVMICCRFYYYPSTFMQSITHPTESLFIPAWLISVGTILMNITQYGAASTLAGDWLLRTMNVLFWVYCGMAVAFSCGIYLILFVSRSLCQHQPHISANSNDLIAGPPNPSQWPK